MKVDTMRFIDKFFGIPLCFFGSLIQNIFMPHKKDIQPKHILFIELSEMGSAIIADPTMREAAKRFDAEIYFVIFKKNKPSLALLQTVKEENIFTIDAENIFGVIKDTLTFLRWTRKKGIDTVVDLELFSRYTALLAGFCGADNVVGFHNFYGEGLYRGFMLTHKVSYNSHIHISKNFMAMINALSEDKNTLPFSKTIIKDDDIFLQKCVVGNDIIENVVEKIKKLCPSYNSENRIVLINPNASELLPQRRWPAENYALLIKEILTHYNDVIVLITGGERRGQVQKSYSMLFLIVDV